MNTIQCPNCGHRFRLLKSDYQAIIFELQRLNRNQAIITTEAVATCIGYSQRQTSRILNILRCAGIVDRYGERGAWYFTNKNVSDMSDIDKAAC